MVKAQYQPTGTNNTFLSPNVIFRSSTHARLRVINWNILRMDLVTLKLMEMVIRRMQKKGE